MSFSRRGHLYAIKSSGPRIDPCGTPLDTADQADSSPLTTTRWRLSLSHALIHDDTWLLTPSAFSLTNNLACGTLSNAFAKSR